MDLLPLLDELQAIARNGLRYVHDPYDRQRYERLLELAGEYYGAVLDVPAAAMQRRLAAQVGAATPHLGATAAIVDDAGRMLLLQRADDRCWSLPGGAVEVNEPPQTAAVRELREETGLETRAVQLVDVFWKPAQRTGGPHSVVAAVYLCEVTGGSLVCSDEGVDLRYWALDEVPVWHFDHEEQARAAYTCWKARTAAVGN